MNAHIDVQTYTVDVTEYLKESVPLRQIRILIDDVDVVLDVSCTKELIQKLVMAL